QALKRLEEQEKSPELDIADLPPVPESMQTAVSGRALADLRQPAPEAAADRLIWANRRLHAIDMLSKLNPKDLKPGELDRALIDLVDIGNGGVAVDALNKLLPDAIGRLSGEQKKALAEKTLLIMAASHKPDGAAPAGDNSEFQNAAVAKLKILGSAKKLMDSGIYDAGQRQEFIAATMGLIDAKSNRYSEMPELRLAAIKAITETGGQTPRRDELLVLLRDRMNPSNESSSDIRLAAFQALKTLNDPKLAESVSQFANSEFDPQLQGEYASMQFESLRPDNPAATKRIFEYQVETTKAELAKASSTYTLGDGEQFLKDRFPWLVPGAVSRDIGRHIHKSDKEIVAASNRRDPVVRQQREEFEKLITQDSDDGQKARAALFFLSIKEGRSDATQTIKQLIKDNVHAKTQLYSLFRKAFSQDEADHETKMCYIRMLNEMLDAKPPQISNRLAGQIAHYALTEAMLPENRGKNWKTDGNAATRQEWLLYLIDKTNYPLAMAQIKGIAEGRDAEGQPLVQQKVMDRAQKLFAKLQDTAPRTPMDNKASADLLAAALQQRNQTLEILKKPFTERVDTELPMDHIKARKAILDSCSSQPIRTPDDPRVVHLQQFLKDPDKGVAVTAAWALLNSLNPINTNDQDMQRILRSQPFMQEAMGLLRDTARLEKPANDYEALWKEHSKNYLKLSEGWNLPYTAESIRRNQGPVTPEQEMFKKASRTLLYPDKETSITDRVQAIDTMVRLAASGTPQLQKEIYEAFKIAASRPVDRNKPNQVAEQRALSEAVLNAMSKMDISQEAITTTGVDGVRMTTFPGGKRAFVSNDDVNQRIVYPDNS
ncbi:MAG: hypothetical protein K2Z81_13930, partial [Cyanobacteria bacterium]|nr:hypothetical protein [Cyanobacteriota bacterium]